MHRKRSGGDHGHCNPARRHLNRILIGEAHWARQTLEQIDDIRFANHTLRLEAMQRRKRKADLLDAIAAGPSDPWRPSKHGPMRELVLTADKDYFAAVGGEQSETERRFIDTAEAWLRDTFGDAVVHARVDLDESACNIHAILMPLSEKKGGRIVLEPSSHPLIKDYERFQDAIGEAFSQIGLVRGERRAEAIREAKARAPAGEAVEIPPRRQHVPPRVWREAETLRLSEQAKVLAKKAEQQAAAEARVQAEQAAAQAERDAVALERARLAAKAAIIAKKSAHQAKGEGALRQKQADLAVEQAAQAQHEAKLQARAVRLATAARQQETERKKLAQTAAEQDAFTAAAEAVAGGLIAVDQKSAPVPRNPADTALLARIRKAPDGLRRFMAAVAPAWAKMHTDAKAVAEAAVQRDRDEIDGLWVRLKEVARMIDPATATLTGREAIEQVIARWRMLAARGKRPRKPGERDRT